MSDLSQGRPRSGRSRHAGRWRPALVLLLPLLFASGARAETTTTFPDWLVPVLQVVTDTDVIPGTGVVIAPGRVLVPAEFAAAETPLVVLDGGGDLARHGRPATVLERWTLAGLALLEVPGLDRALPVLATGPLDDGDTVELWAVAPAELLRQGEATLNRRGRLTVDASGQVILDARQPLPNLTGALVNACGHWVGHSAARGVASLATGANTLYQWLPQLADRLERGGVDLQRSGCDRTFPSTSAPVVPPEENRDVPETEPLPTEATAPTVPEQEAPEPVTETAVPAQDDPPPELDEPEIIPAPGLPLVDTGPLAPDREDAARPQTATQSGFPVWAWGLVLAGLLLVLFALWRILRAGPVTSGPTGKTVAWLEGEGARYPVDAFGGVVDCVVGRNDADVLVPGETISRHHARLRGTPDSLQVIDLDSTNGTFVNGLPCAPRTGVPVNPGDRLQFGDQIFHVRLPGREAP